MAQEFADCWVCEGCGRVCEGVDPPDQCPVCEHKFFECLADILKDAPKRADFH